MKAFTDNGLANVPSDGTWYRINGRAPGWWSSVIQALTDVQQWDQLTVGSSTCRVRRLHLVTGRSPSLVHAPATTYLMPSETCLCHS